MMQGQVNAGKETYPCLILEELVEEKLVCHPDLLPDLSEVIRSLARPGAKMMTNGAIIAGKWILVPNTLYSQLISNG